MQWFNGLVSHSSLKVPRLLPLRSIYFIRLHHNLLLLCYHSNICCIAHLSYVCPVHCRWNILIPLLKCIIFVLSCLVILSHQLSNDVGRFTDMGRFTCGGKLCRCGQLTCIWCISSVCAQWRQVCVMRCFASISTTAAIIRISYQLYTVHHWQLTATVYIIRWQS